MASNIPGVAHARWYAVGLAQKVREVGITALRPADIPAGPRRTAGLDHVLAEGIYGVGLRAGRGFGWLPRRVRAHWRRGTNGPTINLPGAGTSQRQHHNTTRCSRQQRTR